MSQSVGNSSVSVLQISASSSVQRQQYTVYSSSTSRQTFLHYPVLSPPWLASNPIPPLVPFLLETPRKADSLPGTHVIFQIESAGKWRIEHIAVFALSSSRSEINVWTLAQTAQRPRETSSTNFPLWRVVVPKSLPWNESWTWFLCLWTRRRALWKGRSGRRGCRGRLAIIMLDFLREK